MSLQVNEKESNLIEYTSKTTWFADVAKLIR